MGSIIRLLILVTDILAVALAIQILFNGIDSKRKPSIPAAALNAMDERRKAEAPTLRDYKQMTQSFSGVPWAPAPEIEISPESKRPVEKEHQDVKTAVRESEIAELKALLAEQHNTPSISYWGALVASVAWFLNLFLSPWITHQSRKFFGI